LSYDLVGEEETARLLGKTRSGGLAEAGVGLASSEREFSEELEPSQAKS
jgi:hypothetical protein